MKIFTHSLLLFLTASFIYTPHLNADTIKMKTGERKIGKVLSESDGNLLFENQSDQSVIEKNRRDISILSKDPSKSDNKKGTVSLISTSHEAVPSTTNEPKNSFFKKERQPLSRSRE